MEQVCYIFGAGEYGDGPAPSPPSGALVIAADGGLSQLERWGLTPHLSVGDFDSLGREPEGMEVVRHPVMKDDTDMMLAVYEGLRRGCRRFLLYGGLGGRLDHTLANLHVLAFLAQERCPAFLLGPDCAVTIVRDGALAFDSAQTGVLSLFAWGGAAEGVTLSGLLYPLENAVMTPDRPLGVSNEFIGQAARVQVARGSLAALWTQAPGLPLPVHGWGT